MVATRSHTTQLGGQGVCPRNAPATACAGIRLAVSDFAKRPRRSSWLRLWAFRSSSLPGCRVCRFASGSATRQPRIPEHVPSEFWPWAPKRSHPAPTITTLALVGSADRLPELLAVGVLLLLVLAILLP
jgi:hypothetical protein